MRGDTKWPAIIHLPTTDIIKAARLRLSIHFSNDFFFVFRYEYEYEFVLD